MNTLNVCNVHFFTYVETIKYKSESTDQENNDNAHNTSF